MTDQPNSVTKATVRSSRSRKIRKWVVFSLLCLALLATGWRLLFFNPSDADEFNQPTWDGTPKFVATSYSKVSVPADANLLQRMFLAYADFRRRHPGKGRPTYTFGARPASRCSIHGLLNQCMEVTGTRYLMAQEVSAGSVQFGHSNTLNGLQWVAAFEAALQTNQPECFHYTLKGIRRENLLLIREKAGVVKIVPPSRLADYQKAGLVSPDYKPETIASTNAPAP